MLLYRLRLAENLECFTLWVWLDLDMCLVKILSNLSLQKNEYLCFIIIGFCSAIVETKSGRRGSRAIDGQRRKSNWLFVQKPNSR